MLPRYDTGVSLHELYSRVIYLEELLGGRTHDPLITQNLNVTSSVRLPYIASNNLLYIGSDGLVVPRVISDLTIPTIHQTSVTNNFDGTMTIGLAQDIDTISSPTFMNQTLTGDLVVNGRIQKIPSTYTEEPTYGFEMLGSTLNDSIMNIRKSYNSQASSGILLQNSRGTVNNPTNVLDDDLLGIMYFSGYDGSDWGTSGIIAGIATENHTPTNHGTKLEFHTTENGSNVATKKLEIDYNGDTTIYSTTQSTSSDTGSLVVGGGIGIAKNAHFGGNLDVDGYLDIAGGIEIGGNLKVDGTLESASTCTFPDVIITGEQEAMSSGKLGALMVKNGGAYVQKKLIVKDKLILGADTSDASYMINIGASSDDMSIILAQTNAYVTRITTESGTLKISTAGSTSLNISGNNVTVNMTDQATTTTSGAFVVSGGAGIAKDLRVGGTIYGNVSGTITTSGLFLPGTDLSTDTNTGTLRVVGGAGLGQLYVNGETILNGVLNTNNNILTNGTVKIMNTSQSTDTTTGSLVIGGGVGIARRLNIGEDARIYSSTSSVNSATGSLVVNGGIGIGESIFVNNTLKYPSVIQKKRITFYDVSGNDYDWYGFGLLSNELRYQVRVTSGHHAFYSGINSTSEQSLMVIEGDRARGVTIYHTMETSTISSGSLVVNGGMGIAKDLRVGGSIYGTLVTSGLFLSGTDLSTDTNTGALRVVGGAGLGQLYVNGETTLNGSVEMTNTTESSDTATGTLVIGGGVGITKRLNVGGDVQILSTTGTTSYSTGALVVGGGMSVKNDLYVGRTINLTSIVTGFPPSYVYGTLEYHYMSSDRSDVIEMNTSLQVDKYLYVDATSDTNGTSSGALIIAGGAGIAKKLYVGGEIHHSGVTPSNSDGITIEGMYNNFKFGSTATSSSTWHVDGSGSGGELLSVYNTGTNIGVKITSAIQSTSSSTGALVVSGGIGIGGRLHFTNTDAERKIVLHGNVNDEYQYYGFGVKSSTLKYQVSATTSSHVFYAALNATDDQELVKIDGNYGNNGVTIYHTKGSVATNSGALVVSGGVGVAKEMFVGGYTKITSTMMSSSSTSGALIVSGGIGCYDIHVNSETYDLSWNVSATQETTMVKMGHVVTLTGTTNSSTSTSDSSGISCNGLLNSKYIPKNDIRFPIDIYFDGGIVVGYLRIKGYMTIEQLGSNFPSGKSFYICPWSVTYCV